MKKFFLFALVASVFMSCNEPTVNNATVPSININRYLGYWYEIARYDHVFERGMNYVMANYTLRDDGKIDVLNTSIKDGRAEDTKAVARTTQIPGLLKVTFCPPFSSDYRILMVDDNYQYALVTGSTKNYLWILSRTPQLDDATLSLILSEAEGRGYDTNKLIWVKQ
jgi:lipocalin